MATESPLNQSIGKAQRHYRSLFFLPSFGTALALVAAICIATGALSAVFFRSAAGLTNGLLLGAALFAVTLAVDLVLSKLVLKDPIFVLRRTVVLSLFSWILWFSLISVGVGLGLVFGFLWWLKLCMLGFATLLTLRTVVFESVSSKGVGRRLLAILLQPVACIVPFAVFWASSNVAVIDYLPFLVVSPFAAVAFAYLFVHLLDRVGKKAYGMPTIEIFKAFMLNWVAALNAPLEGFLEKKGEDVDIDVSFLKFDSSKPKAAIVVPLVHPGPFKNIGSSLLPSLLKEEYEEAYNCDACVPLGLLGHELDAASQAQNHKIINKVISAATTPTLLKEATPFVRVSVGFVAATCQLFGKTAFLSFTLAPKTTEDLPQELGSIVREEGVKLGLEVIVVNAHNSLTENTQIEASLDTLKDVAVNSLRKATALKESPFEVGSATIHPTEFTLRDGMGTGGITAIVVEVGAQKTAYVVIDGNNMVSGLREEIQQALKCVGFQESEVFTTDTHAVSAVVVGRRGYHPVGEAMDHVRLVKHIVDCAEAAEAKLEPCTAAHKRITVPNVRVVGGDFLSSITVLVDQTIQKAKRIIVPVFGLEGLLLILLLALL